MSENTLGSLNRDLPGTAQVTENELLREIAMMLYAQKRLPLGKARELAGLSLWEFRQRLATRRIEAHYNADDLATSRALGRLS